MQQVPLNAVPRQNLSVTIDGAYWQLSFYMSIYQVCADVIRDGVTIITGVPCYSGIPLMPYQYMSAPNFGNFIFDTDVDWEQFGTNCNLYYLNAAEFAQFNDLLKQGYRNVFNDITN